MFTLIALGRAPVSHLSAPASKNGDTETITAQPRSYCAIVSVACFPEGGDPNVVHLTSTVEVNDLLKIRFPPLSY